MTLTLPPLPYAMDALEPQISRATLRVHYDKHHRAYVDNTNKLTEGTPLASATLEGIIRATAGNKAQGAIFNNAAQAWNHEFYWKSMRPPAAATPSGHIRAFIDRDFQSMSEFSGELYAAAMGHFGSGWTWLVLDHNRLAIMTTANADTPLAHDKVPLLTLDLWEHAYYLDYQNRRREYVSNFLAQLANWDFANHNLSRGRFEQRAAE